MYFEIREFNDRDQAAVILLDKIALADLNVPGLPKSFDDLKQIEKNYLQKGYFVVAEIESEIVGMGALLYLDSQSARINRMRVHPDHRRKGIAKAILNRLEYKAESCGIKQIRLNTLKVQEAAQSLYESNGYIRVGEGNPDGFDVIMYEKQVCAGT